MRITEKISNINGLMLQTRASLNEEAIEEYAEVYRQNPEALPPLETVWCEVDKTHYLVNGYHRLEAAKRAGLEKIPVTRDPGTYQDAVRAALGANKDQLGLRRTNADKRTSLALAWKNRAELFGHDPSKRELAEICGVSDFLAYEFMQLNRVVENTTLRTGGAEAAAPSGDNGGGSFRTARPTVRRVGKAIAVADPDTHEVQKLLDCYGREVPEKLKDAFKPTRINQVIQLARKLHAALKAAYEEGDPAFVKIGQMPALQAHDFAWKLNADKVHAVCPVCGGSKIKPDGMFCNWCHGVGLVTSREYKDIPLDLHLPIKVTADNIDTTEV